MLIFETLVFERASQTDRWTNELTNEQTNGQQ